MNSSGSRQAKSKDTLVQGRFSRFLRRLVRVNAPDPTDAPETWEDDDYFHAKADEEKVFDPWRDDSPEQQLVLQQTDEQKIPDAPPLPLDSGFADSPKIAEEESENLIATEFGNHGGEGYSNPEDCEDSFTHFNTSDEEPEEESFDQTFDFDIEARPNIWGDDPEDLEGAFAHFDDPDGEFGEEISDPAIDFTDELFDYDAGARQSIWEDDSEDVADSLLHARQKAAEIVSRLSCTPQRERKALLDWLINLFQNRDHHTTYRAILATVDSGVSGETLRNMSALRDIWEERQELWLGRYGWARSIAPLRNGVTALTWKLARSVCEARSDFPPEYMIDEAWVHEWLRLRPWDEGFLNFPQFIGLKVMAVDETHQNTPSWSDLHRYEDKEFEYLSKLDGIDFQ